METLGFLLTLALILAWLVSLKVAIDRKTKLQQCQSEKAELEAEIQHYKQALHDCRYPTKH